MVSNKLFGWRSYHSKELLSLIKLLYLPAYTQFPPFLRWCKCHYSHTKTLYTHRILTTIWVPLSQRTGVGKGHGHVVASGGPEIHFFLLLVNAMQSSYTHKHHSLPSSCILVVWCACTYMYIVPLCCPIVAVFFYQRYTGSRKSAHSNLRLQLQSTHFIEALLKCHSPRASGRIG